jgi:hypothetical protein
MKLCTVLIVLLAASPGAAQTVSPGLERANPEMQDRTDVSKRQIVAQVEEFLRKLGNRDVDGVQAMLAPKVLITVARRQADGTFANTYQTRDEFMAKFASAASGPRFEEPISNIDVFVDHGRLAYLRADFKVIRDGRVLSTGIDHFTLVREPDGWKIAAIAYTSVPGSPAS